MLPIAVLLHLFLAWATFTRLAAASQSAGSTQASAELKVLERRSSPTPTTTTTTATSKPLVQALFLPLFDANNLVASVVSIRSYLTTYALRCATTPASSPNTASCGLQDEITVTEGAGTFLMTISSTDRPTGIEPSSTSAPPLSTTTESVTAPPTAGTTIYCTVRGRPPVDSHYAYSKSIVPSTTPPSAFSSIPSYDATAVCTTRSTIEGLGNGAATTTLSGTELQQYANVKVTITAGAAKISQANANHHRGDHKSGGAAALGAVDHLVGLRIAGGGLLSTLSLLFVL